MSSALEISVKRFNKYRERMDAAKVPIIRAFLHLVRPEEGFAKHSVDYIREVWDEWRVEEMAYHAALKDDYPRGSLKVLDARGCPRRGRLLAHVGHCSSGAGGGRQRGLQPPEGGAGSYGDARVRLAPSQLPL